MLCYEEQLCIDLHIFTCAIREKKINEPSHLKFNFVSRFLNLGKFMFLNWVLMAITVAMFQNIPGWWIWFYYICPVSWTLRGIITSQLGDVESIIVGPGFKGTVKEYLSSSLGYDRTINGFSAVGLSVIVLIGFILLFFGSFAVSVKVLNFQKR